MQQRPPTMMNAGSVPQPNTAVGGVPSMRPMVPPSSMMTRPAASPYGVMNRAPFYDKNKRSTYSNDLRQQPQMIQPGQPSQMAYGNVMAPNQNIMPSTVPPGGVGPIRQQ